MQILIPATTAGVVISNAQWVSKVFPTI